MLFRTTVRGNLTVVLECMVHGLDRLLGEEVAEHLGQIGPRTVVRVHEQALEDRLVPHATSCALRAAVGLLRVFQEVQGQIQVLQDLSTVCIGRTGQHLGLGQFTGDSILFDLQEVDGDGISHVGLHEPLTLHREAFDPTALGLGLALCLSGLLVEVVLETLPHAHSASAAQPDLRQDFKFEALIRLQYRALMVAQEVAVLLRSGLATGALARWAAPLFDGKSPKFGQLQDRADLKHWRSHYRDASHGTHANPTGVTWNLQGMSHVDTVFHGPSNAGLFEPARCTLIALTGLTTSLLRYALDLFDEDGENLVGEADTLVRQYTSIVLSEAATEVFDEIAWEQVEQEEQITAVIGRILFELAEVPGLTGEELQLRIGGSFEAVQEALDRAEDRSQIRSIRRYSMPPSEAGPLPSLPIPEDGDQ